MNLGFRLKEERERLGMSQPAFAAVAGAKKHAQINWEKGVAYPNGAAFEAWAKIGVDILYVITGQKNSVGAVKNDNVVVFESDSETYTERPMEPREEALLDNYRHSSDEGKRAVEAAASAVAQQAGRQGNG